MAIPLPDDSDAAALRKATRRTKGAAQSRRLLALAAARERLGPGGTWRLVDPCQRVARHGWQKLPARPRHHAQANGAVDLFKTPSAMLDEIALEQVASPPPWRFGLPMKPGSARRTRSPAAGQSVALGHSRRRTSARYQLIFLTPYAPRKLRVQPWYCHIALPLSSRGTE